MRFDAHKFKKERKRLGLSQSDFARELQKMNHEKASRATVWAWEVLRRQPSAGFMMSICKITNRPIDFYNRDTNKGDENDRTK
jgi:transcriptional regulator with XRE-family HTH domain